LKLLNEILPFWQIIVGLMEAWYQVQRPGTVLTPIAQLRPICW
jgi:hypothetical protein